MALTPEQRKVARRAIRQAKKEGASPREIKALIEAGLVESGLQHDKYAKVGSGDRDSIGFLQQRPSQGWGPEGESVERDASQFLGAARKINRKGFKGSAGQLAQAVQRSAFPGRYDERSGTADTILQSLGGLQDDGSTNAPSRTRTRTVTTPGEDRSPQRRALLLAYLNSGQRHSGTGLLELKAGLDDNQDTPSSTRTIRERVGRHEKARKPQGGDGVRGEPGEIKEMFLNLPGAVNVDNGKLVEQGFVDGHDTHAHIAAGPKRIRQIARLAQKRGLTVRELDGFDKVDPVHTDGSFHYRKRAADISGDPETMAAFTRSIARRFGLK